MMVLPTHKGDHHDPLHRHRQHDLPHLRRRQLRRRRREVRHQRHRQPLEPGRRHRRRHRLRQRPSRHALRRPRTRRHPALTSPRTGVYKHLGAWYDGTTNNEGETMDFNDTLEDQRAEAREMAMEAGEDYYDEDVIERYLERYVR